MGENCEYATFVNMLIKSNLKPESHAKRWKTSAHDQILLALARARSDHGLNEVLYVKDVFVWSLKKSRIVFRVGFRGLEKMVKLYSRVGGSWFFTTG